MCRLILTAAVAATLAGSSPAAEFPFGLFKRKAKPEASAPKAKQHVNTLSTSPDEAARKQAAEELRNLDPRSNAEVFPALIGALQKDPSPAVRMTAADSVGKLKPVYQPAGMVLETVAKSDPDPKVREAAENALLQYHLGGYVTPVGPKGFASAEPPFATPKPPAAPGMLPFRPITVTPPGKGVFYPPTAEPPLVKKSTPPAAAPKPTTPPAPPAGVPQPMPSVAPPAPLPTIPPPTTPATGVPSGPLPPISVPPPGGN